MEISNTWDHHNFLCLTIAVSVVVGCWHQKAYILSPENNERITLCRHQWRLLIVPSTCLQLLLHIVIDCVRLVQQIQNHNCRQWANQKNGVKPPMVEVKVQSAQHFGNYDTIFGGHIHAHQQHRRAEVHSHYLRHNQHNDVAGLARRNFVEEFC